MGSGSHRHTGDSSVHLRHALLHPDLASASLELPGCLLTVGSVASSGLFVLDDIFLAWPLALRSDLNFYFALLLRPATSLSEDVKEAAP